MRSLISCITSLATLITVTFCSPSEANAQKKRYIIDTSILTHAAVAKADIYTFDSLSKVYLTHLPGADSTPIRAFTVRAEDLLVAMGVEGDFRISHHNVRAYLGYNINSGDFKLYIVPVAHANLNSNPPQAGEDIFINLEGKPIVPPNPHDPHKGYVLDLNAPCPNLCPNSWLLEQSW